LNQKSCGSEKQNQIATGEDTAQAINGCKRVQRTNSLEGAKGRRFSGDIPSPMHLENHYLTISRPDNRLGLLTVIQTLSASTDAYRPDEYKCNDMADWFFP
jgi:hypothetical protein